MARLKRPKIRREDGGESSTTTAALFRFSGTHAEKGCVSLNAHFSLFLEPMPKQNDSKEVVFRLLL